MSAYENYDIGELILLCRARDDSAFDELVRRYTPMMRRVITSFSGASLDFSELFSEACVALHLAVTRYELEQSDVTFGLFARICVRNRIVDFLRASDNLPKVSELDIEQLSDSIALSQSIAKMPPLWRRIVLLRYYRNMTQQQTADMLGLSQVKVSREEKKILEFLRGEMIT